MLRVMDSYATSSHAAKITTVAVNVCLVVKYLPVKRCSRRAQLRSAPRHWSQCPGMHPNSWRIIWWYLIKIVASSSTDGWGWGWSLHYPLHLELINSNLYCTAVSRLRRMLRHDIFLLIRFFPAFSLFLPFFLFKWIYIYIILFPFSVVVSDFEPKGDPHCLQSQRGSVLYKCGINIMSSGCAFHYIKPLKVSHGLYRRRQQHHLTDPQFHSIIFRSSQTCQKFPLKNNTPLRVMEYDLCCIFIGDALSIKVLTINDTCVEVASSCWPSWLKLAEIIVFLAHWIAVREALTILLVLGRPRWNSS